MLAADPDAGLEMFGSMQPPLPPSAVLPMLNSYAPQLAGEGQACRLLLPPLHCPAPNLTALLSAVHSRPALGDKEEITTDACPYAPLPLSCPPAGAYLESALASGAADPAVYEQELARIYLERILAATSTTGSTTGSSTVAAAGAAAATGGPTAAAGEGQPEAAAPEYAKLKQLVRHHLAVFCAGETPGDQWDFVCCCRQFNHLPTCAATPWAPT
jgi:hypothetical protein